MAALATPAAAAPVAATPPGVGRALILIPLELTRIQDLSFGSVVTSSSSGTVTINASTGARTLAGGVSAGPDVGQRARFGGAGSPGQQVIVVVNPPAVLTDPVSGDTVDVLAITLDGSPIRTIDPVSRTFFFHLGGVLQIGADQTEGLYAADLDVIADYQ